MNSKQLKFKDLLEKHLNENPKLKKHFEDKRGFGKYKDTATELLKQTTIMLDEFEINYFLISGTLLGYVRHNDFIPWDDDIDIIVDIKMIEKLKEMVSKYHNILTFMSKNDSAIKICFRDKDRAMSGRTYGWNECVLNKDGKYNFPFIDLFTYESTNDKIKFFKKDWDINQFFPINKVVFLGMEAIIPKNPDYFLARNYGLDYMTILKSGSWQHKTETHSDDSQIINLQDIGENYEKKQ
jgi:phosphorylcholine metabolism protein LicD